MSNATILLTANGDFETGDVSSWASFPTATSTSVVTSDANSGSFGAEIFNDASASAGAIKQEFLGIGQIVAGQEIMISCSAKG